MSRKDDTASAMGTIEIEGGVTRSETSLTKIWRRIAVWVVFGMCFFGGLPLGLGFAWTLGQYIFSKQIASEAASKESAKLAKESTQQVALISEQFDLKTRKVDELESNVKTAVEISEKAMSAAEATKKIADSSAKASAKSAETANTALEGIARTQSRVDELLSKFPSSDLLHDAIRKSKDAEAASQESAIAAQEAKSQVDKVVVEFKRVGLASETLVSSVESFRSSDPSRYVAVADSIRQLDREFSNSENLTPSISKEARNQILAKLNIRAALVSPDEGTRIALLQDAAALVTDIISDENLPLSKRVVALVIASRAHVATTEAPSLESKLVSFKKENKSRLSPLEREQIDAEIILARLRQQAIVVEPAKSAANTCSDDKQVLVSTSPKAGPTATSIESVNSSQTAFFRNMIKSYSGKPVQCAELAFAQAKLALALENQNWTKEVQKKLHDYVSSQAASAIDLFANDRQACLDIDLTLSDELLRMCRIASCPAPNNNWIDVLGMLANKYKFTQPIPTTNDSALVTGWLEALLLHLRTTAGTEKVECICTVASTCIGVGQYQLAGTTIESAVAWFPTDPCPHYLKAINEFAVSGYPIEANSSFHAARKLAESQVNSGNALHRCTTPLPHPLRSLLGNIGCRTN